MASTLYQRTKLINANNLKIFFLVVGKFDMRRDDRLKAVNYI